MDMPTPTDAHKKLEMLAGSWTGQDILHPSPWDPKGAEANARVECRMALDGFVLLEDYEQKRDGKVSFTGHAVYSYDAVEGRYTVHWWDSMGMRVNVYHGQFEGDVLEIVCVNETGHSKITTDLSEPGKLRFHMDHSQDGVEWSHCMESVYERTG